MWWPVAAAGLACLCACVLFAVVRRPPRVHRRVRALAHVDRLTRLPEYTRVVRAQMWSTLVVLVLLVGIFLAAVVAGARPVGAVGRASAPQDVMLCVGGPVTDPATAGLLNYFARQTSRFDTQRIGLTSSSLRVVPMTRDYRYAGDSFLRYARLAELARQSPLTTAQEAELRSRAAEFDRPLDYVDYARSVEDVLALCLAGFPAGGESERQRSLIYLGDSSIRPRGEQRPALFNAQQVTQMARDRGVQLNVVTSGGDSLRPVASGTGGSFRTYNSTGTEADLAGSTDPALSAALDEIRSRPTQSAVSAEAAGDTPGAALVVGVILAALLCASLAVVRR